MATTDRHAASHSENKKAVAPRKEARESISSKLMVFALLFALLIAIVVVGVIFSPTDEPQSPVQGVPIDRPATGTSGTNPG